MDVVDYLAFCLLALLVFTVPGWLWLRRAGLDPLVALYAGPGAVALYAAAVVALGVVLPWDVRTTCEIGAAVGAVITLVCAVTAPSPLLPVRADLAGMAVFAVAFLSLAAFSGVPSAPFGGWNSATVGPGRVDTPRWPGLPSDNTLPYRTGQVALYKQGGPDIRDGFSVGWWLSDRTPLTGLDFAFMAGAFGVHVSDRNVEEQPVTAVPMTTLDHAGFWAYQVTAMLLNLAIILGVFLLARVWLSARLAVVAALVAAVMPGLVLNGIYTWPKQAIGYFVLAGAAFALQRRPVLTGAFAALGYLVHPAGLFWIPALLILLLADPQLRTRWRRTAARFVAPAVVLIAPWSIFTSQVMHAVSRWTTAPLGTLMVDPADFHKSLSVAWRTFRIDGPLFALWSRVQSTAASLFPTDLNTTPSFAPDQRGYDASIVHSWVAAHGFSVWGMAGVVLAPFAVFILVGHWPQFRRVTVALVVPALVLAELANGEAYPFANQSMFALVGLVAIIAAYGLLRARRRWRWGLFAAMAFELLTVVYAGLYRPFNIAPGAAIVLTVLAAAGQLGLLGALAMSLDLVDASRLRRPLPGRGRRAAALS